MALDVLRKLQRLQIPGAPLQTVDTPSQGMLTPLPAPALPQMTGGMQPLPVPQMPAVVGAPPPPTPVSNSNDQLMRSQGELSRLQSTGAGVDQIHNGVGRTLAKIGSGVYSALLPGFAQQTPGTELHHQMLMGQQQGQINEAQKNLQGEAQQQDMHAQGVQRDALAQQEQAKAFALTHPKPSAGQFLYDKAGNAIGFQDPSGNFLGKDDPNLPHGVGDILSAAERKRPTNPFELWQIQNPKGTAEDYLKMSGEGKVKPLAQQLLEAESQGDVHAAAMIRRVINETQVQPKIDVHSAEATAPGTWTTGFDADKNPVMFNNKTGEVKPMSGTFNKANGTTAKIGADEQKRADLAKNMNENIDRLESILTRRPDLAGPIAGRLTQAKVAFGTSDPDAAELMTIEHQLGMVAQGAHGMRSAQGVESAANSLVNGFKNSPEATKAALESARKSVGTFLEDSQNPGKPRGGSSPASAAPKEGDTKVNSHGDAVKFSGGKWGPA